MHAHNDPLVDPAAELVGSPDASPELPVTTLGDYGNNLPIGVVEGTPPNLAKGFAFKPYLTSEEIEFGKLRRKKGGPGDHNGKLVAELLAHFLTEWGGDTDFAKKSHKVRLGAIVNAHMVDVLYAYLCLRVEALGELVEFEIECPRPSCSHRWRWSADLTSLDFSVVRTLDDLNDLTYDLRRPLRQGDREYDVLTLTPPKWSTVYHVSGKGNEGEIKSRLVLGAVKSVSSSKDPDAPPIAMGSNLLGRLPKRELEELIFDVNNAFPNIDLTLEPDCPACEHTFTQGVNWKFDFFFGPSSLPRRKRG